MARIPFATKQKSTPHAQNTTTTTTMEKEDSTDEGSDPVAVSTTTEDPTWSPPASQTTETAGIAMTVELREETTSKMRPKLRNETGGRGSRATVLEHTARPKNNSTDRARYTDSETNEGSSDQGTPSGTAETSMSWLRKKVDLRQQRPSHS